MILADGLDSSKKRNKGSRTQPHITQAYHSLSSTPRPEMSDAFKNSSMDAFKNTYDSESDEYVVPRELMIETMEKIEQLHFKELCEQHKERAKDLQEIQEHLKKEYKYLNTIKELQEENEKLKCEDDTLEDTLASLNFYKEANKELKEQLKEYEDELDEDYQEMTQNRDKLQEENEKLKEQIKTLERENRITLGAWKYEVEKLKKLEEKIKDIKEFLEVCDKLPSGMFKHYETRQIATRFEDDEDEDA